MKQIIIIIAIIVSLVFIAMIGYSIDNRATENLIRETEEKVYKIVAKDIYEEATNTLINNILSQLQNTGQVQINLLGETLILIPKQ